MKKLLVLALFPVLALAQVTNPPTWNPPQPPIFIGSNGQVLTVQPSGALAFSGTGLPTTTIPNNTFLGNISGSAAAPVALDPLATVIMSNTVLATTYSAIANVASLSGSVIITQPGGAGVTPANGTTVLLSAQSTASQNGPWLVNTAGAWTRPPYFPSGDVIPTNCPVAIRDSNTSTIYVLTTTGAVTIDTSNQTWTTSPNIFAVGNAVPITIRASNSTTTAAAGTIFVTAGSGAFTGTGNANAGAVNIQGGAGGTGGNTGQGQGGNVAVSGGAGGGTSNGRGGNVTLTGGAASATAATVPGGNILITAGAGGAAGNGQGGQVTITPGAAGGSGTTGAIQLNDSASNTQISVDLNGNHLKPYSAGGTALPACAAATTNVMLLVTDATAPTYGGTYTSGGTVTALVLCNGTNWLTH